MLKIGAVRAIGVYQRFLSGLKPRCCRFYPSCSEFARQSFEKNGFFRAFVASFLRIAKCNPYFAGGFDYPKVSAKQFERTRWQAKQAFKGLKFLYVPCENGQCFVVKIVFYKERK